MPTELLAPAGDFETALAAFAAGADAVYCGLSDFSARAFAKNFSSEDLRNLLRYAHASREGQRSEVRGQTAEEEKKVGGENRWTADGFSSFQSNNQTIKKSNNPLKVYVTFNTVIDEDAVEGAIEQLALLDELHPDALIVQDLGVARICRRHFPDLELHASTQLVAHNLEGVLALGELGFKRVVLARELSLEEIASIAKRCGDIELECFIHGALCYSLSGLCLFGAMEKGRSGNRGKCPYCCREGRVVENLGGGGERGEVKGEGQGQQRCFPFSMKDLRLGEDARKLAEAGVASLKIEGRMKSPLYVASVTKYYRQILGERSEVGGQRSDRGRRAVSVADLETVFSRRTTELYFNGRPVKEGPVDPASLGHLGTPIGVVKKVTRDREGLAWLRFHTCRGLEKHDGLQFEAMTDEGRHLGMAIVEMRQAISRRPVFEVNAGVDVEVLLPGRDSNAEAQRRREAVGETDLAAVLKPGMRIYCSMSNAVKRMFPTPSFRPSDYAGGTAIDVKVSLARAGIACTADADVSSASPIAVSLPCDLQPAKNPEKTYEGVKKAFSKLGETDYRLGKLTLDDPEKLFAPMSVLNDLRRDLVERLDEARDKARREKIAAALAESGEIEKHGLHGLTRIGKTVKVRFDQKLPAGDWDEIVVAINQETDTSALLNQLKISVSPTFAVSKNQTIKQSRRLQNLRSHMGGPRSVAAADGTEPVPPADGTEPVPPSDGTEPVPPEVLQLPQSNNPRLALPVYTAEPEFNKLRSAVKRFLRAGYDRWEASDLATLRMLKQLGVTDITADWTLYAFNSRALAALSELGVKRFVASPENNRENLQYLAESGYAVEFLAQQSTPLFVSLTEPAAKPSDLAVFRRDGLWVTTKPVPRTFDLPQGVSTRLDLSWDPT